MLRDWVISHTDPVLLTDEERFHYWPSSLGIGGHRPDARRARRLHGAVGHMRGTVAPVRRVANAFSDPIHILFVLDMVAQVDPRTAFASADLCRLLTRHYPTVIWDAQTVGRILTQLSAVGYESMERAGVEAMPPLQTTKVHGRVTYTVTKLPGGRTWLLNALLKVGDHVAMDLIVDPTAFPPYRGDAVYEALVDCSWASPAPLVPRAGKVSKRRALLLGWSPDAVAGPQSFTVRRQRSG